MKSLFRTVCLFGCLAALGLAGCQREEKILDVDAPGIDIEIKKTGDDHIDVQINEKDE